MNVVFIDRDGTLIVEPPDEQIDTLGKLEFIPGIIRGLQLLVGRGYELVMVSNQDYLGSAGYPQEAFDIVQQKLLGLLAGEGIHFSQIYICPHGPQEGCACRKPQRGLVQEYLDNNPVDLAGSFVIGDRATDVAFARAIGCRAILLLTNDEIKSGPPELEAGDLATDNFLEACRYIVRSERSIRLERNTLETAITVEVALDGTGAYTIDTGVGFFDHMLAQLARHSGIDMTITAKGDLHIDEHHTVEDTGIALGDAIRRALGDKRGIGRYGFLLPMDEAQAQVGLDLGGRPYLVFDVAFTRERVGDFPTELTEEFFRAFSTALGANLHITATARNDHHRIESIFKGVARALRMAVERDPERSELPSTKGTL
jgi:imidazoleglycerol-phosphate dehydratase/histidinol-phosphatase